MNVAARFPLLLLPNDERIEVLRHMDPINLVKISFLSKRAKEIIISRECKAESIQVIIDNTIFIRPLYEYEIPLNNFYLSMRNEYDGSKKVEKPKYI
ncbi:hypothetical protein CAEBREN_24833 [Caenorhabditis brenneri]|uniref:F-box domain-containing protein n=1 Tax=Caenorhabditis brenneri TaxID=135651 RepID=G0N097_CAEBE|nr:hypothetical protein CAEBREN_24833 [Caenorhabditis brenneri]